MIDGYKTYKILLEFHLRFPEELSLKDVEIDARTILTKKLPFIPLDIQEVIKSK